MMNAGSLRIVLYARTHIMRCEMQSANIRRNDAAIAEALTLSVIEHVA